MVLFTYKSVKKLCKPYLFKNESSYNRSPRSSSAKMEDDKGVDSISLEKIYKDVETMFQDENVINVCKKCKNPKLENVQQQPIGDYTARIGTVDEVREHPYEVLFLAMAHHMKDAKFTPTDVHSFLGGSEDTLTVRVICNSFPDNVKECYTLLQNESIENNISFFKEVLRVFAGCELAARARTQRVQAPTVSEKVEEIEKATNAELQSRSVQVDLPAREPPVQKEIEKDEENDEAEGEKGEIEKEESEEEEGKEKEEEKEEKEEKEEEEEGKEKEQEEEKEEKEEDEFAETLRALEMNIEEMKI